MWTRKFLRAASWPCFSFSTMSGSPAAARKVGSQSWCWMISLETTPGAIRPGQRTISGTRKAPSQLVFFSLRNGSCRRRAKCSCGARCRWSRRRWCCRRDPEGVQLVQQRAHDLVVVDHGVVVGRLPAPGLPHALRLGMGPQVHVGGVEPDEERRLCLVLAVDEAEGVLQDLVVDGLHR